MAEVNPPLYMESGCYTAEDDRNLTRALICAEGVHDLRGLSMAVVARSPAIMGIRVGTGSAFVQGDSATFQGMYYVLNAGSVDMPIDPADPTDARIDRVVARVHDSQYDAGPLDEWRLEVISGMPSPAPAAPALPPSSVHLGYVTVPAGATSIVAGNVDRSSVPQAALCRTLVPNTRTTATVYGAGSYSITPPTTWQTLRLRLWGGGGGSGSCAATGATQQAEGGPGGGAGYVEHVIDYDGGAFTWPQTLVVGAGGAAGAAPNGNGAQGGDTTFLGFIAGGGGAGLHGVARSTTGITGSGNGGSVSGGAMIQIEGSDAVYGRVESGVAMRMSHGAAAAGGGGGACRPSGAGSGGSGITGRAPGGGAAGAINSINQSARPGGVGAAGRAILEWAY